VAENALARPAYLAMRLRWSHLAAAHAHHAIAEINAYSVTFTNAVTTKNESLESEFPMFRKTGGKNTQRM
jgi:hypothetical protein